MKGVSMANQNNCVMDMRDYQNGWTHLSETERQARRDADDAEKFMRDHLIFVVVK